MYVQSRAYYLPFLIVIDIDISLFNIIIFQLLVIHFVALF